MEKTFNLNFFGGENENCIQSCLEGWGWGWDPIKEFQVGGEGFEYVG